MYRENRINYLNQRLDVLMASRCNCGSQIFGTHLCDNCQELNRIFAEMKKLEAMPA